MSPKSPSGHGSWNVGSNVKSVKSAIPFVEPLVICWATASARAFDNTHGSVSGPGARSTAGMRLSVVWALNRASESSSLGPEEVVMDRWAAA